jgi:hypothetical protein
MPVSTDALSSSHLNPDTPCVWMTAEGGLPADEDILVWSAGKAVVGSLMIAHEPGESEVRSLIDVLGNEILPWPTYWMRIPTVPSD